MRPAGSGASDRRLLVIDDEPRVSSFVERCLSAEGYSVDTAVDGSTGLAKALEHCFQVVLLDLSLPDVGGVEVLSRIREAIPAQPVLVISASADDAVRRRCLELGAVMLSKPFTGSELLAAVSTIRARASAM